MRPFPSFKYQSRYDSDFLKFWQNTYKLAYPPPGCLKDLGKIEQPILDQATPLVQSSHPSKIGTHHDRPL